MKTALTVTGALLVALAVARPFAQQPTTRLALEVQDYASLPIRKVVAARPTTAPAPAVTAATPSPGQNVSSQPTASLENPVAATPASIAAGKRAYDANCAACHGNMAQGAVKAGMTISIIEEQKGKQPPDLTDAQWDNGSSDGDIYAVIKRGLPPTMMAGYDGRIPDNDIWSIVNYLRTLPPKQ